MSVVVEIVNASLIAGDNEEVTIVPLNDAAVTAPSTAITPAAVTLKFFPTITTSSVAASPPPASIVIPPSTASNLIAST